MDICLLTNIFSVRFLVGLLCWFWLWHRAKIFKYHCLRRSYFIVICYVFLCIAKHLHDFTVGLTNTLPTTTFAPHDSYHVVCRVHSGVFPVWGTLTCTNLARGRYLFIQNNGDLVNENIPSLCEVEVYCKCTHSATSSCLKHDPDPCVHP